MTNKNINGLTNITVPLAGTEVIPIWNGTTTTKVSVANLTAGRAVAGLSFTTSTGMFVRGVFGTTGRAAEFNGSDILLDGAGQFDVIIGDGGVAYMSITTTDNAVSMKIRDFSGGVDLITVTRSSGDATINKGNLVQGTAAKGINFTANTPGAGMTSQLLNWYEEGTFTPVLSALTGAFTSITYTTQTGKYTRVGNLITANVFITINTVVTGTAATCLVVSGLPFTASAGGGVVSFRDAFVSASPDFVQFYGAGTNMLFRANTATGYVNTAPSQLQAATGFQLLITYYI
jgi:hypothetical protein